MEHALLFTYCVCYNNFILKQTYLHCYRCHAEANWHQKFLIKCILKLQCSHYFQILFINFIDYSSGCLQLHTLCKFSKYSKVSIIVWMHKSLRN